MTPLGLGIGAFATQLFISNNPDPEEGLSQVKNMNYYYAIIGSILIVPSFFFFQNKPPTPPR